MQSRRHLPHFSGDGLGLSPGEYGLLLAKLAEEGKITGDTYSSGGVVTELETRFAELLGKERAVFVATGTLANNLALRSLAGDSSRVVVQSESHVYNDSFDCVQQLSHLNLVPVGAEKATFTVDEVEHVCSLARRYPFPVSVGALSIECPVRRHEGQLFEFEEMKRIHDFARAEGMRLHLDGARLLTASAYTGIRPAEYAALFDTVYVSLYKGLNAAAGAIVAGPAEIIETMSRDRKMFGAGLAQAWPYAAVALHFLDTFIERLCQAIEVSTALFAALNEHPCLQVESHPLGTNLHRLHVTGATASAYLASLEQNGVFARSPEVDSDFNGIILCVNESILASSIHEIADLFTKSLEGLS